MTRDAFCQRVAESAQRLLPPAGTPLVVAVSGGADSLALLAVLVQLQQWPLRICHVDHGLRPARAAAADRAAITALLTHFHADIQPYFRSVDVRAWAQQQRCGIEEAARHLRYAALAELAQTQEAPQVLTAHHADDQAETIVHHLLRGCGPVGQWGMAECRPLQPGVDLVRPLLGEMRQSCQDFLRQHGLAWNEDESNSDLRFTRNWLRHRVLPNLEQGAPGFAQELCAWAQQQRQQQQPLWQQAQAQMQGFAADSAMPVPQLQAMTQAQRWMLWRALAQHLGIAVDRQWCHRCDDLLAGSGGRSYHHGAWLLRRSRVLITWHAQALAGDIADEHAPAGEYPASYFPVSPQDMSRDPWLATVDADGVQGPLRWRRLRPGERWQPLQARGSRLVKRGLTDRGVSAWQRARLRVLADDLGVVWVPGWTIAHRVRLTQASRRAWQISAETAGDICPQEACLSAAPTR